MLLQPGEERQQRELGGQVGGADRERHERAGSPQSARNAVPPATTAATRAPSAVAPRKPGEVTVGSSAAAARRRRPSAATTRRPDLEDGAEGVPERDLRRAARPPRSSTTAMAPMAASRCGTRRRPATSRDAVARPTGQMPVARPSSGAADTARNPVTSGDQEKQRHDTGRPGLRHATLPAFVRGRSKHQPQPGANQQRRVACPRTPDPG